MKIAKKLIKKTKQDGCYLRKAILDWKNTPTKEVGGSPTQRLMSRRTMTGVLKADVLLKPHVETNVKEGLTMRCKRLQKYCDKIAHELLALRESDVVRMKLNLGTRLHNGIVVRLSVSWVNVYIWWTYIKEDIKEIRIITCYIRTTKYNKRALGTMKYDKPFTNSSSKGSQSSINDVYSRNRRELTQKSANWRVRVLPGKQNQKFQNKRQVTEMAT